MHPILFKIGPITVYTYGFFVALGAIIAFYHATWQAKENNVKQDIMVSLFLWIIVSGFLGARILYVITEFKFFLDNPVRVFFANEGFVFFGGLIFASLAVIAYSKKHNLDLYKIADILAAPIALAHSIGRIGCFFYGCCYGKPTDSCFGLLFPPDSPAGQLCATVIPTQLISSFALLIIFCILVIMRYVKSFDGQVFFSYVFMYAIFRFIIEFFRGDPRGHVGVFSTSQVFAMFAVLIAMIMFFKLQKTRKKQ